MDESVDLAWVLKKTNAFFKHESCGKCTPCREGTYWMLHAIERIAAGGADGEVMLLRSVASGMQGKCLCALGEFSTMPVVTGIDRFPEDFQPQARGGR
jgi:NADH-quinone oxidoreductase subunit F